MIEHVGRLDLRAVGRSSQAGEHDPFGVEHDPTVWRARSSIT